MKKLLLFTVYGLVSIALVSCGQKSTNDVVITADTPIENKNQAAKVCEPVVQYITCSIEKASDAGKADLQKALSNIQREIQYDDPVQVAQRCDSMVRTLLSKPEIAFKNGCFIQEPSYMKDQQVPQEQGTVKTETSETQKPE